LVHDWESHYISTQSENIDTIVTVSVVVNMANIKSFINNYWISLENLQDLERRAGIKEL
jgi:hypothetical protein